MLAARFALVKERSEDDAWHNRRLVNEAFEVAKNQSRPVHINVPLNEPLYHTAPWKPEEAHRGFEMVCGVRQTPQNTLERMRDTWRTSSKIMVLVTQHQGGHGLLEQLRMLNDDPRVAIVTETTASLHHLGFVCCIDRTIEGFLGREIEADFVPELLITIGENIVSKKLKSWLRKHQSAIGNHWHFGSAVLDTFQCLTLLLDTPPTDVLRELIKENHTAQGSFGTQWRGQFFKAEQRHHAFLETAPYSDLSAMATVLDFLPEGWQLQMGNSSVVRYIQLFNQLGGVRYFGNRGVSGIEGCTSTAVGAAMKSDTPVLLISGDHAFRYDANGLSVQPLPDNLRIVVINNGGGNIFRIIEGPEKHGVNERYIEHAQHKSVKGLVEYHGVRYLSAGTITELEQGMEHLVSEASGCTVLEVFTPRIESPEVLKSYFRQLSKDS